MRKCLNCKKKYQGNFDYCIICGSKLQIAERIQKTKGVYIALISVISVTVIILGYTFVNSVNISNTKQDIEANKYQNALQEQLSKPSIFDLRVNSGWTKQKDGNYIYIKGSVTNISSIKTISYFEVSAKFYDSRGNVIDSDYTNDGTKLSPGETRQFEIMHKYNSSEQDIKLSIQEVS